MSLYDLFEHTQLVIVPMIDYLPIPSDPPAPDKWDFWFILKTFGPGIVTALFTGTIAILAYRIAKTQREIAANKYDLDLFDKRYEIFENFIPCHDKINELDLKEYDDNIIKQFDNDQIDFNEISKYQIEQISLIKNFIENDLSLIVNKLEKASRIFGSIKKDKVKDFKKTITDFQKRKENFLSKFIPYDRTRNAIESRIYALYEDGHELFFNDKIKYQEEDILAHKKNIQKLETDIKSFNDEATIHHIKTQISELYLSITGINGAIQTIIHSYERRKKTLVDYNNDLKYLIETMLSLKSEFLNMYNIMDTYLSIKEDAYKQ